MKRRRDCADLFGLLARKSVGLGMIMMDAGGTHEV
jgi:hypothetical protein